MSSEALGRVFSHKEYPERKVQPFEERNDHYICYPAPNGSPVKTSTIRMRVQTLEKSYTLLNQRRSA